MFTNNYSTEEKQVCKWIDGKPLYQKTIIVNVDVPINAWTNVINITNEIGTDIDYFYILNVISSVGEQLPTDFWQKNGQNLQNWRVSYPKKLGTLTLQYTKTTDQPQTN